MTPTPKPDEIEMPLDYELMELEIPEDIHLLDVPEEVVSDFDAQEQLLKFYLKSQRINTF